MQLPLSALQVQQKFQMFFFLFDMTRDSKESSLFDEQHENYFNINACNIKFSFNCPFLNSYMNILFCVCILILGSNSSNIAKYIFTIISNNSFQ